MGNLDTCVSVTIAVGFEVEPLHFSPERYGSLVLAVESEARRTLLLSSDVFEGFSLQSRFSLQVRKLRLRFIFTPFEETLYFAAFFSVLFRLLPERVGKIVVVGTSVFLICSLPC